MRVVVGGDGSILFINRDYTPIADRLRVEDVGPRDGSCARRTPIPPTDRRELVDLMHKHGFLITGGKHDSATHPRIPGTTKLPLTPSDHRWIRNLLTEVRERFGIDLRAPQRD